MTEQVPMRVPFFVLFKIRMFFVVKHTYSKVFGKFRVFIGNSERDTCISPKIHDDTFSTFYDTRTLILDSTFTIDKVIPEHERLTT